MPQKKHKPEEIVAKLRQVDVLLSQGRPVAEAIRAISVTSFTYIDARVTSVSYLEPAAELLRPHQTKKFVAGA